jgi:hypothetical protein
MDIELPVLDSVFDSVFEVARSIMRITILAYPCHGKSESRDSWSNIFPLDD